ncbi:MAG: hypothetical protein QXP39_02265 [Candidatus Aenigmatarchaeota archaeon]
MKGQNVILEAVLLFGIGVAIFLMCESLFLANQNYVREQTEATQLEMVKSYIISAIYEIASNPSNVSMNIDIPTKVGESTYIIMLSENNITLQTARYTAEAKLEIDCNMFGRATSSSGKLELKKTENKIFIE